MKKALYLIATMLLAMSLSAGAQPPGMPGGFPPPGGGRGGDAPSQDNDKTPANLTFKAGLFGVAQNEKDWYFEIPDEILGRRILAVTRFVSNTPGASEYGGEEVNEAMVYWEKASNGNLLLRADVLSIAADEGDDIAKAVKVSAENPIVASFKPETGAPEGATRVKVTSLFEGDTQVFSLDSRSKRSYNLGNVKGDASFINSSRTSPINTDVTVTKT